MVDLSTAQLLLLGSQPPLALDGKQVLGSDTKNLLRIVVLPLWLYKGSVVRSVGAAGGTWSHGPRSSLMAVGTPL